MASHVIGIDLGSYAVKVAVVVPGLRQSTLVAVHQALVPSGPEPVLERSSAVAARLLREHKLEGMPVYVAIPGRKVFIHVLEFPFKSLRRAELDSAVGGELESVLPIDLEDMVYAFEPLPRDPVKKGAELETVGDNDPTSVRAAPAVGRVAPITDGMRVIACAMQKSKAKRILSALDAAGSEPRGMLAAPASYGQVARQVSALDTVGGGRVGSALIDIGHQQTDVCVLSRGRVDFVRTISRGGEALTAAVASKWNLDWVAAESAKHTDGFIGSSTEPPASEAWQRIHDALLPEMEPLARDLKRTLSACRAKTGVTVERVVLVGGGSRLKGISSFLSEKLGVAVSVLGADDARSLLGPKVPPELAADTAVLALGVALEGASGRPQFDLRSGELAFKADLSFLRARIGHIAAALMVIIAFAAANGYMSHYKLRKAEKVLTRRLEVESTGAFGESLSAAEVLARIEPSDGKSKSPIPKLTAYDTLLELNSHLPARDKVKVDIDDLRIEGDKVTVKATAFPTETTKAIDGIEAVQTGLKKSKCFKEITEGESQPDGENRRFSLTLRSEC